MALSAAGYQQGLWARSISVGMCVRERDHTERQEGRGSQVPGTLFPTLNLPKADALNDFVSFHQAPSLKFPPPPSLPCQGPSFPQRSPWETMCKPQCKALRLSCVCDFFVPLKSVILPEVSKLLQTWTSSSRPCSVSSCYHSSPRHGFQVQTKLLT